MTHSNITRIDPILRDILKKRAETLKTSEVAASRDLAIFIKIKMPEFTDQEIMKEIEKKRKQNNGFFQI
jgi:hypothetical protein